MDEVSCPRILWGCPVFALAMAIWTLGACVSVRWSEQDLRRSEASVRALLARVERLERQMGHLNIGE